MLRSITAVVIGFLVTFILVMSTDAALRLLLPWAYAPDGSVTSVPVLVGILLYVAVFAILGTYLTARLAPRRPMGHALALGVIALLGSIPATIAYWSTAPVWYHVAGLVLVMPLAWVGGRLRERQLERRVAPAHEVAA